MKNSFMWSVLILTQIIALDLLAAYFLFHYHQLRGDIELKIAYKEGRFPIQVLASRTISKLGMTKQESRTTPGCPYSQPSPFFRKHQQLGWSVAAGRYDIFFCQNKNTEPMPYKWTVTIKEDASQRATSIEEVSRDRRIYIFGDSSVFGWGINDENTFAWHLQDALREEWEVQLFANGGYGNVHNLIQFRMVRERVTKNDILVFGYGGYFNARNVAAPSSFASVAASATHNELQTDLPQHPKAMLVNGEVQIDYLPLDCARVSGYCDEADPSALEMAKVTRAIFDEILQSTPAKVALLFLGGEDDDPLISYLKEKNVEVIDVRRRQYEYFVRDRIGNYDSHPGPLAHYTWYKKIMDYVSHATKSQNEVHTK